jgi:3-oxoacyl-[acyl-carrier protein] reductase
MKAIVTGGNRGIGLEISKKLLGRGFEVHVLSRSGIASPQVGMISWTTDVSDYEQTIKIIEKIGQVDVLINNAGIMTPCAASLRDLGSRNH